MYREFKVARAKITLYGSLKKPAADTESKLGPDMILYNSILATQDTNLN